MAAPTARMVARGVVLRGLITWGDERRARHGVFLRAETMHGTAAYLSEVNSGRGDGKYNFQGHGSSPAQAA